jgi:hypothetical protein
VSYNRPQRRRSTASGGADTPGSCVIGDFVPREALLARTLVELADTLVADFDVVELMSRLADRCVEVLDVGAAGSCWPGPTAS